MSKYERSFTGDFSRSLQIIHNGILGGSVSASFESGTEYTMGDVRIAARVYERFSYAGGNRLTCTIVLSGKGNDLRVTAITSGGSQAMFFKINTWGEEAFLEKVSEILRRL